MHDVRREKPTLCDGSGRILSAHFLHGSRRRILLSGPGLNAGINVFDFVVHKRCRRVWLWATKVFLINKASKTDLVLSHGSGWLRALRDDSGTQGGRFHGDYGAKETAACARCRSFLTA